MNEKRAPKKTPQDDWHVADIKAALEKAGWSLRRLSLHHGYSSPGTLQGALHRRWPKGERLIAAAIGADPAAIWPSRYQSQDSAPDRRTSRSARRRSGSDRKAA